MNLEKLVVGENVIAYLTSQRYIPLSTPRKTVVGRLQTAIKKAESGIEREVKLAVMGDFLRLDTNNRLHLPDYYHAEIFEDRLEILDLDEGYISIEPTGSSSLYKLYI